MVLFDTGLFGDKKRKPKNSALKGLSPRIGVAFSFPRRHNGLLARGKLHLAHHKGDPSARPSSPGGGHLILRFDGPGAAGNPAALGGSDSATPRRSDGRQPALSGSGRQAHDLAACAGKRAAVRATATLVALDEPLRLTLGRVVVARMIRVRVRERTLAER